MTLPRVTFGDSASPFDGDAIIDVADDRIVEWEDRLDRREAQLVRQFAALDRAHGRLLSHPQWLADQLAGCSTS